MTESSKSKGEKASGRDTKASSDHKLSGLQLHRLSFSQEEGIGHSAHSEGTDSTIRTSFSFCLNFLSILILFCYQHRAEHMG